MYPVDSEQELEAARTLSEHVALLRQAADAGEDVYERARFLRVHLARVRGHFETQARKLGALDKSLARMGRPGPGDARAGRRVRRGTRRKPDYARRIAAVLAVAALTACLTFFATWMAWYGPGSTVARASASSVAA